MASNRLPKEFFDKLNDKRWMFQAFVVDNIGLEAIGRLTGNPSGQTAKRYCKKHNLINIKARWRSLVLQKFARRYIAGERVRALQKEQPWIQSNDLKDRIIKLGGTIRAANSYERKKSFISKEERTLAEWVRSLGVEVITSYNGYVAANDKPSNKFIASSIDIYLPDYKLGIEYNGLYYHAEWNGRGGRSRHINKLKFTAKYGIRLLNFWSDEWKLTPEIVKSMIMNQLKMTPNKVYARNTSIISLNRQQKKQFLMANHIQGDSRSTIVYGLEYQNKIVSVMVFDGKTLARFCNLLYHNVVGGFSKLLNHIKKNHPEVFPIVSYSHNDWSLGDIYLNNGFKKVLVNPPSYSYYDLHKSPPRRQHRSRFQKKHIVKKFNFPSEYVDQYTESELIKMIPNKDGSPKVRPRLLKIWDCGTTKWVLDQ